ncbi:MAG: hypothetical protein Q9209_005130 [Squamulea sp. 1 TL-2023]
MLGPKDLLYGFALLLSQIITLIYCTFTWQSTNPVIRKEQRARRRKLKERPDGLPQRKRSLSRSSLQSSTTPLPPLLRLPVELRLAIYDLVISNKRFELKHIPKHIVLQQRLEMEAVDVRGGTMAKQVINWKKKLYNLSLPLTCRRFYHETIDLLYSSNTFVIDDPHVLINLAAFCLPPQRLRAIRHLDMTWKQPGTYYWLSDRAYDKIAWEECWTVVTTKLQLSSLRVVLKNARNFRPRDELGWNYNRMRPLLSIENIADLQLIWTLRSAGREESMEMEELEKIVVGELEKRGNRVKSFMIHSLH